MTENNMTVPLGFRFRPFDEELVEDYLRCKIDGKALPCGLVIERDIYGDGDKAPWQIFTDQDPWEICKTEDKKKTEGTIYVFTALRKASAKKIARMAGCGCWSGETAPKEVKNEGRVIGYKRMLCFEITKESGYSLDKKATKGHWIMHEYSLGNGNILNGTGEYVLCRIKFDDSKETKKSLRKRKNVEAAVASDDELVIPRPTKRARTEFVQEQRMEFDVASEAPETTEVVPFLEEIALQEEDSSFIMSDGLNSFTCEGVDEVLGYFNEPVSAVEQGESFMLDYYCDDFGNITFSDEVDPSSHLGLASSVPVPIVTSKNNGKFQ